MAQFPCGSVGIPFSLFKKHPFSWPEDKQLGLAQPRAPEALKKFFKLNKNFRLPPRQSNILGLDPVWGVDFPSHLKQLKDETKYMKQQFSRPWTSSNQGWRSPRNKTNTVSPLIAPAAWRDQLQTLCWGGQEIKAARVHRTEHQRGNSCTESFRDLWRSPFKSSAKCWWAHRH